MMKPLHRLSNVESMEEHTCRRDSDLVKTEFATYCFDELTSLAAIRTFKVRIHAVSYAGGLEHFEICEEPLRARGGRTGGRTGGGCHFFASYLRRRLFCFRIQRSPHNSDCNLGWRIEGCISTNRMLEGPILLFL